MADPGASGSGGFRISEATLPTLAFGVVLVVAAIALFGLVIRGSLAPR